MTKGIKFYDKVWRLAVHFNEPKMLERFKNDNDLQLDVKAWNIKIIRENSDFILLESGEPWHFNSMIIFIIRHTTPEFLTLRKILK